MTVQLEKYGTSMAFLEGFPEGSLFFLKKKNMAARFKATSHKTSRTMPLEQMKAKWRCLVVMHNAMFGEN